MRKNRIIILLINNKVISKPLFHNNHYYKPEFQEVKSFNHNSSLKILRFLPQSRFISFIYPLSLLINLLSLLVKL